MALAQVLAAIDKNLDRSLERLFALMRIEQAFPRIRPLRRIAARLRSGWRKNFPRSVSMQACATPKVTRWSLRTARRRRRRRMFCSYGHYDVQPADPLPLWQAPAFEPQLREVGGRKVIVGRGSADDKGQLMTFVEAVRAFVEAEGKLPLPVTILLEGEEETGSPSLAPFLEANKNELKADVCVVCDTDMWNDTTPAITTMLRGLMLEESLSSRPPTVTFTPGCSAGPRSIRSACSAGSSHRSMTTTAALPSPVFTTAADELDPEIKAQWTALDFSESKFLGEMGLSIPAGEKGRHVLEQMVAADLRREWNYRRLYGHRIEDSDFGTGLRQVFFPSGRKAESRGDPRVVPRLCPQAVAAGLRGGISGAWRQPCAAVAVDFALSEKGARSACCRMGHACGAERLRRFDSDRGQFQARSRYADFLIGFGVDDDRIHSPNEKYNLTSFHKGARSRARILHALRS